MGCKIDSLMASFLTLLYVIFQIQYSHNMTLSDLAVRIHYVLQKKSQDINNESKLKI